MDEHQRLSPNQYAHYKFQNMFKHKKETKSKNDISPLFNSLLLR